MVKKNDFFPNELNYHRFSLPCNSLNRGIELSGVNDLNTLSMGESLERFVLSWSSRLPIDPLDEFILMPPSSPYVNVISVKDSLTNPSLIEANTAKKIVEMISEAVIVADYSKFDKVTLAKITDIAGIDTGIADHKVPKRSQLKVDSYSLGGDI